MLSYRLYAEESPPTTKGHSRKGGLERDGNGSETKPPMEWDDVENQQATVES